MKHQPKLIAPILRTAILVTLQSYSAQEKQTHVSKFCLSAAKIENVPSSSTFAAFTTATSNTIIPSRVLKGLSKIS